MCDNAAEVELDGEAKRGVAPACYLRDWERAKRIKLLVFCTDRTSARKMSLSMELSDAFANLNSNFTANADDCAKQRMSWRPLCMMNYGGIQML